MLNTLKTTAGYLLSLVSQHTPLKFYRQELSGYYRDTLSVTSVR